MFLTLVRSAWVAILIQIVTLFILARKRRKILFILLFALIIPAFFIFTQFPEMEKRMTDLAYQDTPFYYRHIGSGRIGFWEDITVAFWNSPFMEKVVGNGFRSSIFATEIGVGAHNDFIDLLLNNGVLGLGIMLWIIGGLFKIGKKLSRTLENRGLAWIYWSVFWGFITVAFINGIIFYVGAMWYISVFVGLACAELRFYHHRDFR
jgi:O-antigen ligase